MRRAATFVALLVALPLGGCATEPARFAAAASTIVRGEDGTLWLTSPDDDEVVRIDPESLEVLARVAVAGAPEQLAFVGDALLVTLDQAAELCWIEGGTMTRVSVPCGGTRAVVADGHGGALVTCPYDDRVLRVSRDGIAWEIPSSGRPTALAVLGDRFAVSASRLGRIRVHALGDGALLEDRALVEEAGFAATQVDAIAPDVARGDFVATYTRVDHDSDRSRPAEAGGYGSVVDSEPRIEPLLAGPCGSHYARFDGGPRVFSGPSALATAGSVLWVAHRSTDDVVALECDAGAALAPRVATFTVGRGPRGVVTSEDGRVAWVDVGFGGSVARLELTDTTRAPEGPLLDATLERTRTLGPSRLSEAARRGRAIFHDADDTHLTPSGVVTCATCHPGGGEDGLSWFLHTPNVGPKLRRTPPAWAARPGLAPFHWDGEFDDAALLSQTTIRELMEGDGLLVDTAAIAAWMAESPIPIGRPIRDDADRALVDRGRAVFDSAGCATCHAGELLADESSHDVLSSSSDDAARMSAVGTPSLRAIRARPPYLHDGRAPTLREVLVDANPDDLHGATSDLSGDDVDALVAYLETL